MIRKAIKELNAILTPEQVAKYLQISLVTVYRYLRSGRLCAIRFDRVYRIKREDLERFLRSRKTNNNKK